jgi:hypothetical protein
VQSPLAGCALGGAFLRWIPAALAPLPPSCAQGVEPLDGTRLLPPAAIQRRSERIEWRDPHYGCHRPDRRALPRTIHDSGLHHSNVPTGVGSGNAVCLAQSRPMV